MSQQPTFQITKEHFVGVINSLREQYVKDKNSSEAFGQIFNAEAGLYDNSALINSIFSFLHEVFPKDEDGHSEIEHYCYVLSFGRNGDDYESPEELYDRLNVYETLKDGTVIKKKFKAWGNFTELGDAKIESPNNDRFSGTHPIAPEDAFSNFFDGEMSAFNAGILRQYESTSRMMFEGAKNAKDRLDQPICCKNPDKTDARNPSAQLIDEIGLFPFNCKKGLADYRVDPSDPKHYTPNLIKDLNEAHGKISIVELSNRVGKPSPDETA